MGVPHATATLAYGRIIPKALWEEIKLKNWSENHPEDEYLPELYGFEDYYRDNLKKDYYSVNVEWVPYYGILLYSTKTSVCAVNYEVTEAVINPTTRTDFQEHVHFMIQSEAVIKRLGLAGHYGPEPDKIMAVPNWMLIASCQGPS
jgi:hypothetical protein